MYSKNLEVIMKQLKIIISFMVLISFLQFGCYTRFKPLSSQSNPENSEYEMSHRWDGISGYNSIAYQDYMLRNHMRYFSQISLMNAADPLDAYLPLYYWWPKIMPRFGWVAYNYSFFDYYWYENPYSSFVGPGFIGLYSPWYTEQSPMDYRSSSFNYNKIPVKTQDRYSLDENIGIKEKRQNYTQPVRMTRHRHNEWESDAERMFKQRENFYRYGNEEGQLWERTSPRFERRYSPRSTSATTRKIIRPRKK